MQVPPDGDLLGRLVPLADGDHQADDREQSHQHGGVGSSAHGGEQGGGDGEGKCDRGGEDREEAATKDLKALYMGEVCSPRAGIYSAKDSKATAVARRCAACTVGIAITKVCDLSTWRPCSFRDPALSAFPCAKRTLAFATARRSA